MIFLSVSDVDNNNAQFGDGDQIQRRTTIGLESTRKTQKAWLISLDKFLLGVITTTMAMGNVIQMIVVKL